MQLKQILTLEANLELLSGLRIGASEGEIRIGGVDNQVIRNPHNNQPYIPGSSLKGKVRSLLEWRSGAVQPKPLSYADLQRKPEVVMPVLQLFGFAGDQVVSDEDMGKIGISRLAFWDCPLNPKWAEEYKDATLLWSETKSETAIDRIAGTAARGSLRTTERVPAGAQFRFRLSIKQLDIDGDGEALLDTLLAGLRLLELDSLGGSGSRGYGKVKFQGMTLDGQDIEARFDAIKPFDM